MTVAPKPLPPVYVTIRDDARPGRPVADIEIRYGERVFQAALFAGRSEGGKDYLRGTARPAGFEDRLEQVFSASQKEAGEPSPDTAAPEAESSGFSPKPAQVWLFYNKPGERPASDGKGSPALSGYWGVNDTGERLRVSVWMT